MFPNQEPDPVTKLNLDPPTQPSAPIPAAESLQFRTAEMPDSSRHLCSVCNTGFDGDYYHVNGLVTCPACAQTRLADQQQKGTWGDFGRSALCGLGAAVGGSIIYALVSLTGFQFSLVAILVGVMVGKSVLFGSRGIRGRRYQILAVVLTYGSITTSMIPEMIREIGKMNEKRAATANKDGEKKYGAAPVAPKQAEAEAPLTGGMLLLGTLFLIGLALIAPIFGIASVSGILNILIIGIGLMQAWRRTAADASVIAGPYQTESAQSATA